MEPFGIAGTTSHAVVSSLQCTWHTIWCLHACDSVSVCVCVCMSVRVRVRVRVAATVYVREYVCEKGPRCNNDKYGGSAHCGPLTLLLRSHEQTRVHVSVFVVCCCRCCWFLTKFLLATTYCRHSLKITDGSTQPALTCGDNVSDGRCQSDWGARHTQYVASDVAR